MSDIVNIAAYKFVDLDNLEQLQAEMLEQCLNWDLKGTILLGDEGINLILAGGRESIDAFTAMMDADQRFQGMDFKESLSKKRPFRRMRVRLKKEIVTMKVPDAKPKELTGKHLPAQQLKQWLDENKDFTFIDTRNDYEIEIGTFEKAQHFDIEVFSEFPEKIQQLDADHDKPMVMFCTGGIRCEKASIAALEAGFKEVYQLEGGILKYFQEIGAEHYQGDCFVFDQRTAITPEFAETGLTQCPRCNHFISPEDQQHPDYIAWKRCQYCPKTESDAVAA